MSERDELARELFIGDNSNQSRQQSIIDWEWLSRGHMEHGQYKMMADAILAAGWTKPRTVTTVEELDALPVGSMVLDSDPDALLKTPIGKWRSLIDPDEPFGGSYLSLPATVLYTPEPQS